MKKTIITSALILGSAVASQAATVTINNHSFENGTNLPNEDGWTNNDPEDWTTTGTVGLQDVTTSAPAGIDGHVVVFLQTGELLQNITTSISGGMISAGDVFTLTLAATNQNGGPTFDFDIQNTAGTSLIGGAITSSPNAPGGNIYGDIVVTGTVDTASSDIVISIGASTGQIRVDNIQLDLTAVPEPSSAALLGLGGLALILRRRK